MDGSLSLAEPPDFPEPYEWRIPRSSQLLIFSKWGDELPYFDDVIDLIERAQRQIQSDIDGYHGDTVMKKITSWTEETATLVTLNDEGGDGMTHRELIRFLAGLRLSGEVFGFWSSNIALYDSRRTSTKRGEAILSIAKPGQRVIRLDGW